MLEVWKLRSSIGRSICSFLCRVCCFRLFRQNYRRAAVCRVVRVLQHTAIPRTNLLAWRLEASEEQVRTSGSWASFADRTSCTGCRPFSAPASAQNNTNTERPCLPWGSILRPHSSRSKNLHLRTREHHNQWFRASKSYCLVNIRYVEQYLVIMVIMIINTIISV